MTWCEPILAKRVSLSPKSNRVLAFRKESLHPTPQSNWLFWGSKSRDLCRASITLPYPCYPLSRMNRVQLLFLTKGDAVCRLLVDHRLAGRMCLAVLLSTADTTRDVDLYVLPTRRFQQLCNCAQQSLQVGYHSPSVLSHASLKTILRYKFPGRWFCISQWQCFNVQRAEMSRSVPFFLVQRVTIPVCWKS